MVKLYVLSQDSESKVVGKEQWNRIGIGGVTRYPRYPRCMMYYMAFDKKHKCTLNSTLYLLSPLMH